MRIKVTDGEVVYATHFINASLNLTDQKIIDKLAAYQVEPDGIIIYPGQSLFEAQKVLDDLRINCLVELQKHDPGHMEKTKGNSYSTRSEAIAHLTEGKEPESWRVKKLEAELANLKAALKSKGVI